MKLKLLLCCYVCAVLSWHCSKNKDNGAEVDLQKGLKLHFPLNGNFNDSTGYTTAVNSNAANAKWVADRKGNDKKAMFLDGGIVTVGMPSWNFDQVSLSVWIKRLGIQHDNYFIAASSAAFGVYESNQIRFAISTPATNSAGAAITTDWTHIAGTYNGEVILFYVNGELVSTTNHPDGQPDPVSMLKIGDADNENWKGGLDELRIYDRLLNSEEIKQLANE